MTEMKENPSIIDESGSGTTRMVTKSNGTKIPYSEEHLRNSLDIQLEGLNRELINTDIIISKVSSGLYNGKLSSYFILTYLHCAGVTTKEITNLAAETCAYMAIVHPDYTKLANRVTV